jgi:glycosyltransferase involved in cell wall biosynthesis
VIVFISDFDLRGSGYMNIAVAVCTQLAKRGHDVKALGMGYAGGEHSWPFSIMPIVSRQAFVHIPAILQNMQALAAAGQIPPIQALVVALDIPMQERLLTIPQREGIPYLGIFPIESGPLCQSWANVLASMDKSCVISKFGLDQMDDAGIPGTYLPIGLDTESWRRPLPNERKKLREAMGYADDQLVVLTVADNQERKNLSAGMDIIKEASKTIDVQWMLVTRIHSQVGWKLDDMATEKGIMDRFAKFERGLAFDRLWTLYAIADVFLLPSKAEGLCMPIIEAMAAGAAVVATDCTAVPEHIFEDRDQSSGQRGFPMDVKFKHQDPWGNSIRSYVDYRSGARLLWEIYQLKKDGLLEEAILAPARDYAESRTWDSCGEVLDEAVREIMLQEAPPSMPESLGVTPITVPRPIPLPEEIDDEEREEKGEAEPQSLQEQIPTPTATADEAETEGAAGDAD